MDYDKFIALEGEFDYKATTGHVLKMRQRLFAADDEGDDLDREEVELYKELTEFQFEKAEDGAFVKDAAGNRIIRKNELTDDEEKRISEIKLRLRDLTYEVVVRRMVNLGFTEQSKPAPVTVEWLSAKRVSRAWLGNVLRHADAVRFPKPETVNS